MVQTQTALCASLPLASDAVMVPDWLHLLPTGEARTLDGRGPYRIVNAAALAASSSAAGKLPLDENHATDLAAPRGGAAPARGWIVELQARTDGIWGRVEWTGEGRRIIQDRQYRGVSPVIAHTRDGTVTAILRASLTNTPNLTGLQSLHSRNSSVPNRPMSAVLLAQAAGAYQAELAKQGVTITFAAAVRACEASPADPTIAPQAHRAAASMREGRMDPVLLARDASEYQAVMEKQGMTISFAAAVRACGGGFD